MRLEYEIRLVTPVPEDALVWAQWRSEPHAQRHMPMQPISASDLKKRLAETSSDLSNRSVTEYRWMIRIGTQPVGTVAVLRPSWSMGYAEISYHIGERFHRRGIGKRAVVLLIDRLFAVPEMHHLFATVSHDNVASRTLLEALGFRHEGTLREHFRIGSARVDQRVYGLLRREWSANAR